MATFSILLHLITSTFIYRQAGASYRAPFPQHPKCEQRNLAALISSPSLFTSAVHFLSTLLESELAQDQAGARNRSACEWSDTDCASSN